MTVVGVSLLVIPVVVILGASTARACSCSSVDPIDAVGQADVVFTGTAVSNEGSEWDPSWTFAVEGVVKGDVSPVEVVAGEDWAGGCGTDFGRFNQPVVVYAVSSGDRLRAISCTPAPTAAEFAAQLDAFSGPTGTGPPAAVMVGRHMLSDIAILDGAGRTITRTNLGLDGGAVAHCPGTSLVAVVSNDRSAPMSIVDLATFAVTEQRPLHSDFVSVTGDRLECLDGGARVVAVTGYGPNEGSVSVAMSSSAEGTPDDVRRTFDDVSRAVVHPAGSVLLLPNLVGVPIRALSADDLEPTGAQVPLPDGASTVDGDVSPDGSKLAILATLSGRAVDWDTGGTHVITLDLIDGLPVVGSADVVPLAEPGDGIESLNGAAKWIRWADAETWIIESETTSTKTAQFVAIDGAQVLPPTDIGWGWGLVPLDSGVLRARNGGLEIIAPDGVAVDGDPAPPTGYVDRILALDQLTEAPTFDLPTPTVEVLTITPVEPTDHGEVGEQSEGAVQTVAPDSSTLAAADEPSVADSGALTASSADADGDTLLRWSIASVLVVVMLVVVVRALVRRRGQLSPVAPET